MKLLLTAAKVTALGAALLIAGAASAQGMGGGLAKADTNGDGKVSLAEFKTARIAMMMRADTNRDGKLSQAELEAVRAKRASMGGGQGGGPPGGGPGGGRMFQMMDANHDGALDKAEIGRMMERRFQKMDVDGDGFLSSSELAAARPPRGMGGQGGAL